MANTSATGGYLTPSAAPAPLEGKALVDFVQEWVVGITGIDPTLVRPRWNPEPGNIPERNVTWIALGIMKKVADTNAVELHGSTGAGYNEIRRHEEMFFLASFYGPDADNLAHVFREGIQVAQNREVLTLNNMGLIESGDIRHAPELIKEVWLERYDMPFSIRRQIVRRYEVLDLLAAQGVLNNEHYLTDFKTDLPIP